MKIKNLKSLTIVPQEMYVERDADRQLASIFQNMGRPGYVLVARQMGKTNLLLHAKRSNEGSENTFSYQDVSNQFPDLRSFFRNIIDTIVETSSGKLEIINSKICSRRNSIVKLPHKEHESELLEILRSISGNLIICLDEIDALTKSSYSDQVFSFIRSVYFSGRSNFSEFNRITYVLSGVAEPADIIKNKDISPFNIGEKIYLEDFSEDEASELMSKSSFPLNKIVNDRVFFWASGHPRMTWDIGSALEDMVSIGQPISEDLVDSAVKKLYFSELDNPPIDHIKRLAIESQDIRDSLISIHYGRSQSLSESVRTTLYLAGITKVAPREGVVRFKNKIIEDSLSESFILKLPPQTDNEYFDKGISAYADGDYIDAISYFKSAIRGSSKTPIFKHLLWLAKALFRAGEYESVKDVLHDALPLIDENKQQENELEATYLAGAVFLRLDLFKEAVSQLTTIIRSAEKTLYYYEAVVDYLTASLELEKNDNLEEHEALCRRLLSERAGILGASSVFRSQTELFSLLHYLLAQILLRKRSPTSAASFALNGIEFASLNTKIMLLNLLYDSSETRSRQIALRQCIALLRQCKGFSESAEGKDEVISIKSLYDLLSRLSASKKAAEMKDVLNHLINDSKSGLGEGQILKHLLEISIGSGDSQVGIAVLDAFLSLRVGNISAGDRRHMLRSIILLNSDNIIQYARRYFDTFDEDCPAKIDDIAVLNNIVINSLTPYSANISATAISIIKNFFASDANVLDVERKSIGLLISYLDVLQSFSSYPSAAQIASARSLFLKITKFDEFSLIGFLPSHIKQMQSNLSSILKKYGSLPSVKNGQKIGRNDFVTVQFGEDRQIGKYKKFEIDLQNGACTLIGKGIID